MGGGVSRLTAGLAGGGMQKQLERRILRSIKQEYLTRIKNAEGKLPSAKKAILHLSLVHNSLQELKAFLGTISKESTTKLGLDGYVKVLKSLHLDNDQTISTAIFTDSDMDKKGFLNHRQCMVALCVEMLLLKGGQGQRSARNISSATKTCENIKTGAPVDEKGSERTDCPSSKATDKKESKSLGEKDDLAQKGAECTGEDCVKDAGKTSSGKTAPSSEEVRPTTNTEGAKDETLEKTHPPMIETLQTMYDFVMNTFLALDADGNGTLQRSELKMLFSTSSKGLKERAGHDDEVADNRYREVDLDGNGVVVFQEFIFALQDWGSPEY